MQVLKALSLDSGPPKLLPGNPLNDAALGPGGELGVEFVNGGDEHGKLMFPQVRCKGGTVARVLVLNARVRV